MVSRSSHAYVIGLVGKAGSGKSTVARILVEEYHFDLISLDEVGHHALELSRDELIHVFGQQIVGPDGTIQRAVLGQIVFGNMDMLLTLNAITHPRIKELVKQQLSNMRTHTLLDGALLYEIGLAPLCDFILMVDAPEAMIMERLIRQRKWPEEKAKSVLFSQRHLQFLREEADFIIFNNDSLEKIERQVEFFVHTIS
ncbi:dephospho-CoA kinase [Thermospira aquatica]|uniref:Dephospho-CoA kinase n=1 Tax=Thermospira aquatica TaxID=2828656 RepID=A0AAX3BF07_9SPIR|nr:dephospho-CoA kinase [Thermospira aquatica]URA10796.1 dephospho-CoA kinase [Thermospira aquatica]